MKKVGVAPVLEIFEPGMLYTVFRLRDSGKISKPGIVNILLGVEGASAANERELRHLVGLVPEDLEWAVAGICKYQNSMIELGIKLGGNVRVGMEDNPRGDHANWSNVDSVKKAVDVASKNGRNISSPTQARKRLGLPLR